MEQVVKYYKMYVCENARELDEDSLLDTIEYGFITNKALPAKDLLKLNKVVENLGLSKEDLTKTLFSRKELETSSQTEKIIKQLFHYISFGTYGVQSIELDDGEAPISVTLIKVVTKEELKKAIEEDIYADKPLASDKVLAIYEISKEYEFNFDFSKVKNRELRAYLLLKKDNKVVGVTGEDVLRTIILVASSYADNTTSLLINSKEVKKYLHECNSAAPCAKILNLMQLYKEELAAVFNRYKDLFINLKHMNPSIINKISKLSKTLHKPVGLPLAKTFISRCVKFGIDNQDQIVEEADKLTVKEKLTLLNVLAVRSLNLETRTFVIRNGKIWTKKENEKFDFNYSLLHVCLQKSLRKNLQHLKGKVIKYPKFVDYGLPISEKMSCGNVPFGTIVSRQDESKTLIAGMYWRNEWGSRDLDLSSIDVDGRRIGWGYASSYEDGVIFSGDITNAPDGAIECIGNPGNKPAILVNNIYSGEPGSKFKIVVGEYNKDKIRKKNSIFLENTLFNFDYKFQGDKRSCILGALDKDKFILYPANLGSSRVSSKGNKAALRHILAPRMTMKTLLEKVAQAILVDEGDCDIDLSLEAITFQDLVKVLEG